MRNPTLTDVARKAGVSPITASRALSGSPLVATRTRDKVQAAADALNYAPNTAARALATGNSAIIAMLIPSITNAVFADVLSGAFAVADDLGLTLQLINTGYSAAREESALRLILNQRPRGIIVAGVDQSPVSRAMLQAAKVPVVQIMDLTGDAIDMVIGFCHHDAAAAAARHLLDMGYRHPGALAAQLDPRTNRRMQGFAAGLRAGGQPGDTRIATSTAPSSLGLGARLLRELLDRYPDTDAVFCNNDDLALGALFEAQRLGLSVPRDLGICGFNNLEATAAAEPGITSVRTHRNAMGRRAVERIVERGSDAPVLDLGFEVIARGSTKRSSD